MKRAPVIQDSRTAGDVISSSAVFLWRNRGAICAVPDVGACGNGGFAIGLGMGIAESIWMIYFFLSTISANDGENSRKVSWKSRMVSVSVVQQKIGQRARPPLMIV